MELVHGWVRLNLRELVSGAGEPLLFLHALGGSGSDAAQWLLPASGDASPVWPGPVWALDFSGHGRSGRVAGGAYSAELLAADADIALERLGTAWLAGSGLGAYVALLLAGGRAQHVPGALLLPGAGLAGGGAAPDPGRSPAAEGPPPPAAEAPSRGLRDTEACDPRALVAFERDLRPCDYACEFASAARQLWLAEDGGPRPPWWCAVRDISGVQPLELSDPAMAIASWVRHTRAGADS